jgi:hypothetical protein
MNPRPDAAAVELAIPLKLLDAEPGHFAFFCWQNVTMTAWGRAATGPAVLRIDAATSPIFKERREGVSAIHLVTEGAGMPTAEAREGFVHSMKVNAKNLQCISVVLMGGGFWASTLQSIVTGMRMLAPNTFAMRIDNGFESMLHWFPTEHLRRTGVTLQPNELRAAMSQAFSHLTQDADRPAERDGVITATHAVRRR